jgi:hypothetical protein
MALEERRGDERRVDIAQRARMAYIAGAEKESRRSTRRGLTGEELEQVVEVR